MQGGFFNVSRLSGNWNRRETGLWFLKSNPKDFMNIISECRVLSERTFIIYFQAFVRLLLGFESTTSIKYMHVLTNCDIMGIINVAIAVLLVTSVAAATI